MRSQPSWARSFALHRPENPRCEVIAPSSALWNRHLFPPAFVQNESRLQLDAIIFLQPHHQIIFLRNNRYRDTKSWMERWATTAESTKGNFTADGHLGKRRVHFCIRMRLCNFNAAVPRMQRRRTSLIDCGNRSGNWLDLLTTRSNKDALASRAYLEQKRKLVRHTIDSKLYSFNYG